MGAVADSAHSADPMAIDRDRRVSALAAASERHILVLDGAMGTMIQEQRLGEADYSGPRFADHDGDIKGNNDLLNLTQPALIKTIHATYFEAGADVAQTNTFNATCISQSDYGLGHLAYELNHEGARLAREAAIEVEGKDRSRPLFVAGTIGPTTRTTSISPDVNDPGFRNVTFDELRAAYREAASGLIDGAADLLLVETVFDTLNARAALFAIDELFEERAIRLPIMISGTITDLSGRTLSGQTAEAFWTSVRHAEPFGVGLNCALGPAELRSYVAELARVADTRVSTHPNAGLPNEMGGYDETPESMASHLGEWAAAGLLNIVGGCCGTTPAHITAIAKAVTGVRPRANPEVPSMLRLSGLEPFALPA